MKIPKGNMVSIGGMINIDFDMTGAFKDVQKRLGSFSDKAPNVMKYALNQAAMATRREMSKQAKKRYKVKETKSLNVANIAKIKRANVGSLTAELSTKSGMQGYYKFDVKPRTISITGQRPNFYRGRVLKSSGLKARYGEEIENNKEPAAGGAKAFVVEFRNGHTALVYRSKNKQAKDRPGPLNQHTQAVIESHSPGLMSMASRAFKEPSVREKMFEAMDAEIDKRIMSVLKGR